MKRLLIIAVSLLAGCEESQMGKQSLHATDVSIATAPSRVSVTRIAVVWDDLAYNRKRGIYIITDAKTGAEYVGVSGVGIAELASHGKGISDER